MQLHLEGEEAASFQQQVQRQLDPQRLSLFGAIPRSGLLRALGLDEVAAALDCKPLMQGEDMQRVFLSEVGPGLNCISCIPLHPCVTHVAHIIAAMHSASWNK